jgi:Flp pilus assembly protein TadD
LTQAYAELAAGDVPAALDQFRAAAHRDPRNFAIHRDWAVALLRAGERERARRRMAKALALNPRLILPPGFTR